MIANRTQFEGCRRCLNHPTSLERFPGFYIEEGFAVECDCHKEWAENQKFLIKVGKSGFRFTELNYDPLKNYKGRESTKEVSVLYQYLNEFERFKSSMLYMWGPHSTQKTTLSNWIGTSLIKKGYTAQYVLMNNLIRDIETNYEDKQRVEDAKNKYLETDCLIIDESFDKVKVLLYKSGYQIPFLDSFLRERIENKKKSTIFISNVAPNSIDSSFTSSIISLIKRNTVNKGTALMFIDNYERVESTFDAKDLFANKGND